LFYESLFERIVNHLDCVDVTNSSSEAAKQPS